MKYLLIILSTVVGFGMVMPTLAQADQGKDLFQKKMCTACHGPGKKAGDLKDSRMDKAAMTKWLKDPKSVNPKAAMPAVKGTDAEIASLVDYVMSLRK